MSRYYNLIPLFFFLFLFIIPVYAYLPVDINTTLSLTYNCYDIDCSNLTESDNNIYCTIACAGTSGDSTIYRFNETLGNQATCDYSGACSGFYSFTQANLTHGFGMCNTHLDTINTTTFNACGVLARYIDKLGSFGTTIAYDNQYSQIYSDWNALIYDEGGNLQFTGSWGGQPDISFIDFNDNSTFYANFTKFINGSAIGDQIDPYATWGISMSRDYSVVRASATTVWAYILEPTAVTTVWRIYRTNITQAETFTPSILTTVSPRGGEVLQEEDHIILSSTVLSNYTGTILLYLANSTINPNAWVNVANITVATPPNVSAVTYVYDIGTLPLLDDDLNNYYWWRPVFIDSNGEDWESDAGVFYISENYSIINLAVDGIGGLFGLNTEDGRLLVGVLLAVFVAVVITKWVKGNNSIFIVVFLAMFMVGWAIDLIPDTFVILLMIIVGVAFVYAVKDALG